MFYGGVVSPQSRSSSSVLGTVPAKTVYPDRFNLRENS